MMHFSSFSGAIANSAFSDQKDKYAICTNVFSSYSDISCNRFEVTTPSDKDLNFCQVVQSSVDYSFFAYLIKRYRPKFISKADERVFIRKLNDFDFSKNKIGHKLPLSANPTMSQYDQFRKLRFAVIEKTNCEDFYIYEVEAKWGQNILSPRPSKISW